MSQWLFFVDVTPFLIQCDDVFRARHYFLVKNENARKFHLVNVDMKADILLLKYGFGVISHSHF